MKRVWNNWKQFVVLLGNFQMVIVLTIIYWLLLPIWAIPFKLMTDPLASRNTSSAIWSDEDPLPYDIEFMRRQG